jgi:hypothetical protein
MFRPSCHCGVIKAWSELISGNWQLQDRSSLLTESVMRQLAATGALTLHAYPFILQQLGLKPIQLKKTAAVHAEKTVFQLVNCRSLLSNH